MKNYDALDIYLEVINQDFLKVKQKILNSLQDSKIDKHVFMRFNAFKNIGEIYERVGEFQKAKDFYTQVI